MRTVHRSQVPTVQRKSQELSSTGCRQRFVCILVGLAKTIKFALKEDMFTAGVEVYIYSFFNLGAKWGWVVNATSRPLYPQERDPVPIA